MLENASLKLIGFECYISLYHEYGETTTQKAKDRFLKILLSSVFENAQINKHKLEFV